MNGKSETAPNNDVKRKNDVEEENAVKVKLPSCLSYEGKRHLKLAHNNSDVQGCSTNKEKKHFPLTVELGLVKGIPQ